MIILHVKSSPKTARELFEIFEQHEQLPMGEILAFEGVGDKDVYNITAPFEIEGRSYITGRVEPRHREGDSDTYFFEERNRVWTLIESAPTFCLEDPFVTRVGNKLVFGGVETFPNPDVLYSNGIGFRTIFYQGNTLQSLRRFAQGSDFMKDIRLIELPTAEIAVFTRPQRPLVPEGGRGKIGFIKIPNLEALTPDNILKARIVKNQFLGEEWGGINELHLLEDNRIGVLGHIAYNDTRGKHYYAMVFTFDPETEIASPLTIIAARKNFPSGPAKRSPELDDVIFPGGLIRRQDRTVTLYTGLSDTSAGRISIPDPWPEAKRNRD